MKRVFLALLLLLGTAALAAPPIPTDGATGHTIYIRPKVEPRIIDDLVQRLDSSGMIYTTTVSRLNFGAPLVYPTTVGRRIYSPSKPDYWGDDSKLRSELWEDAAGTDTWPQIKAVFPELPALFESAVRDWAETMAKSIANPYRESEQKTWPYQREEARSWERDNTAPTPFCDGLAIKRGVPRELFLQKVLENTALFEVASQQIFGTQQALLDLITYSPFLKDILSAMNAAGIKEVRR